MQDKRPSHLDKHFHDRSNPKPQLKFNQRGAWQKFAKDSACRLDQSDLTIDGRETAKVVKLNFNDCKSYCEKYPLCTGIEHNAKLRRCEIWTKHIGFARPEPGYQCLRIIQL